MLSNTKAYEKYIVQGEPIEVKAKVDKESMNYLAFLILFLLVVVVLVVFILKSLMK